MPKDFRQDANGKEPKFKREDLVRVNDYQSPFNNWEGKIKGWEGRSPTGLVVQTRVAEWHYFVDFEVSTPGGGYTTFRLYFAEGKLKDGMD